MPQPPEGTSSDNWTTSAGGESAGLRLASTANSQVVDTNWLPSSSTPTNAQPCHSHEAPSLLLFGIGDPIPEAELRTHNNSGTNETSPAGIDRKSTRLNSSH